MKKINPIKRHLIDTDEIVTLADINVWRDLNLEWPDEEKESETGNTVVFTLDEHN